MDNTIRVNNLLLIPTNRAYNDVYKRGLTVSTTSADIHNLENMFNMLGVKSNNTINDMSVVKNVPNIIKLSSNTSGVAGVINGWSTIRLKFLMEVESVQNGHSEVSYIQGYTEHYDPSILGSLDESMKFYINSITTATNMYDPITGVINVLPTGSYNVISNLAGGFSYQEAEGPVNVDTNNTLMRPIDIIGDMTLDSMKESDDFTVVNTTGVVNNTADLSARGNNDGLKYFTKTINSVISAKSMSSNESGVVDMLRDASSLVTEKSFINNPFVYALHIQSGDLSPTSFTLAGLNVIQGGGLENVTTLVNGSNTTGIRDTMLDSDHTENLLQPTIENLTATTLSHAMTSIMAENMVMELDLSITNLTGIPVVIVNNVNSFIKGMDVTYYINRIITNVREIVMAEITHNGNMAIEAFIHADLLSDTSISVSINRQQPILYRFPTFADSLYSPVMTDNLGRAGMVEDITNVVDSTF